MRLSRQDVALAARSFARTPVFTVVAVLSLALAIALNTTMYSVIDAMVSPNVDVRDPGRLYVLQWWVDYKHTINDVTRAAIVRAGLPAAEDVSSATRQFTGWGVAVEYGRLYAQVGAQTVAPNYFAMLGVHMAAGRVFGDADYTAATPTAMITEGLANRLSPEKPFPVGASVDIDGTPHVVIGVIANRSRSPSDGTDLFMLPPQTVSPASLPITTFRLRKGATLAEADAQMKVISARLAELAREDPKTSGILIKPFVGGQFQLNNFDYALVAAVVAVLLVACANLSNLQLARGIGRTRELALRSALGASRGDIVGQLMLESALLAAVGLVSGLIMTYWGIHLLAAHIPRAVAEYVIAPQTSWRVLVFAVVACVACVLLVGLFPAIKVSRVDPNELLKSGHGTGANKHNRQQYGIMVAVEIGLSLALLAGASIIVRAALDFHVATSGDLKFLSHAWVYQHGDSTRREQYSALTSNLLTTVRGIPDVADAAYSIGRTVAGYGVTYEQRQGPPLEIKAPMQSYAVVSPGYLRTWRREVVKGHDFVEGYPHEPEVIVDERAARTLWPGIDPIGLQIKLGSFETNAPWARVVGVAKSWKDPRSGGRLQYFSPTQLGEIYYLPSASDSVPIKFGGYSFEITVRAKTDPERMPITLTRYLRKGGRVLSVRASTMEELYGFVWQRQSHDFIASVFTLFAAIAIGLAAIGIYGIVAHSVAERKRELGVRLALGASARNIIHAVIRDGNVMALAGVAIGLYLTKRSVFWLHAFSREGDEYDFVLFAIVAAVLFAVAVLSALGPALRATRIDPVESLRSE